MRLEATVPCQLLVSSVGARNAHNRPAPRQYANPVALKAISFRVTDSSDGPQGHVVTSGRLTVPADWPPVKPFDRIVLSEGTFDVDGEPQDASAGPFTALWVQVTGAPPGRLIELKRAQS